ncbi:hypothetical protein VOLCADRAFT_94819 [Volvox carteri f. nagariensis]|uniref:Uncharacterized protein n=1 Tax=Volvox carteri f. nagariensis TaxID=3068 RepID=D8U5U8_VOLCA|nr:uncharacterized protein VOLCADRAFT_94819 [Volvox carteri f. nagariensis]EFJ44819.1 hypothetical protein VOLCADRAFT_94819 [Volvox carteri f. nagariensis]|eukprot:XP_002954102.1 hypothetical protein VOLCADRAFT_94819 [Volvox carteri f. nagariensis]
MKLCAASLLPECCPAAILSCSPPPSATERYPPHLFCRRSTICLRPISQASASSIDANDHDTFASVLAYYTLELCHVHYTVETFHALRTRRDGMQRPLQATRRARQAAINGHLHLSNNNYVMVKHSTDSLNLVELACRGAMNVKNRKRKPGMLHN